MRFDWKYLCWVLSANSTFIWVNARSIFRFGPTVANLVWTAVCVCDYLVCLWCGLLVMWAEPKILSIYSLLPDCYLSEQSIRCCFPAVHCLSVVYFWVCFSVFARLYLSSQPVAIPSAPQTTSAQLPWYHLFVSPVGLQGNTLCWQAGCIPRHYCWWWSLTCHFHVEPCTPAWEPGGFSNLPLSQSCGFDLNPHL